MRIPFISTRRSNYFTELCIHSESEATTFTCIPSENIDFVNISASTRSLERRKGGGGRGRGSSGTYNQFTTSAPDASPFSVHVGSSSTSSKSLGKPRKVSLGGGRLPNNKKSATSYGAGGGRASPISYGKPFAGRIAGGGNRQGVYGNRYATPPPIRFSIERSPELTCPCVCAFTVYTGAVILASWLHVASRDVVSRITSGR